MFAWIFFRGNFRWALSEGQAQTLKEGRMSTAFYDSCWWMPTMKVCGWNSSPKKPKQLSTSSSIKSLFFSNFRCIHSGWKKETPWFKFKLFTSHQHRSKHHAKCVCSFKAFVRWFLWPQQCLLGTCFYGCAAIDNYHSEKCFFPIQHESWFRVNID